MSDRQSEFAAALLDAARSAPDGLSQAGRRFDVYRNNVAVSLGDALLAAYPVVTRLLGLENMKGLAAIYLRAHPPSSPLMMHYGAEFPAFLAAMNQLDHLGYLPDMARLDLAMRRAYHAADAAPIDPGDLGALAPETLMQTTVTLAPAVEILRSDWPIHEIWRFNTESGAPKPRGQAQDVLITRPEFDPAPHLLPPGGADWIAALARGDTVAAALDTALANCPEFDPSASLALLLQGNALTSLTTKDI